jgi:secreted PhoX family phosphatase
MPHVRSSVQKQSASPSIGEVIAERLRDPARREVLKTGAGIAVSLAAGSSTLLAGCGSGGADGAPPAPTPPTGTPGTVSGRPTSLRFNAVPKGLDDTVVLPAGYTATVLLRTGDPLVSSTSEYRNDGTDTAASFQSRFGDGADGVQFFGLGSNGRFNASVSDRALIAVNHELLTENFLHPTGPTVAGGVRTVPSEVQKEFRALGVSIVEIARSGNTWTYRKDSTFGRRIDAVTDMAIAGTAGSSPYMVTKYSPDGSRTRGTVSNCAHGYTPWGTYLTCEENWQSYFRRFSGTDNPNRSAKEITSLARYGVDGAGQFLWATVTPDTAEDLYGRWNAMVQGPTARQDYRNVPNTFGWVVEIDPFDPGSTPRKRTALGRFGHEGAWPAQAQAGKPLVWYMGDDAQNEYIYKYISTASWDPADAALGLAAGDKYLNNGKLYAARFNTDGTGSWLELNFGANGINPNNAAYSFADQADVLVNARLAADVAGATRMDRPEWTAVDPLTGAVYVSLTGNATRTLDSTDGANPRYYQDRLSSWGNPNGHILRWLETNGDSAATTFRWDIFLFGARSTADGVNVNISGLTAENDFSMPDSLFFSKTTTICWIHTDDTAYTDVSNCMTLAALPGYVGDGAARTVTNIDGAGRTRAVKTYACHPLGTRLKRFLVGPVQCEMTGFSESPDGKALFVNVQHPGVLTPAAALGNPAIYTSHWPDGGMARPRSATLVITRDDGGAIGV